MELAQKCKNEWLVAIAFKSRPNRRYDIKTQWGYRPEDGVLFMGKYATLRDLGNFLAGYNAGSHGEPFDRFQRMAGALEETGSMWSVGLAYLGKEYGPAPLYGELMIQYRMSIIGYELGIMEYVEPRGHISVFSFQHP